MITLHQNIQKLARLHLQIIYLTNPGIYYNTNYKPQAQSDRANLKHLKNVFKKIKRLNVVISKQTQTEMQRQGHRFKL